MVFEIFIVAKAIVLNLYFCLHRVISGLHQRLTPSTRLIYHLLVAAKKSARTPDILDFSSNCRNLGILECLLYTPFVKNHCSNNPLSLRGPRHSDLSCNNPWLVDRRCGPYYRNSYSLSAFLDSYLINSASLVQWPFPTYILYFIMFYVVLWNGLGEGIRVC